MNQTDRFQFDVAMEIGALLVPSIPVDMKKSWVSIAAWFWLKEDAVGIGGGAHAFDKIGHSGAFSFDLLELKPLLIKLRRSPKFYPRIWTGLLLQIGREEHEVRLTYEFEDPLRWMVTPENFKTQIRANRPDFATLDLEADITI